MLSVIHVTAFFKKMFLACNLSSFHIIFSGYFRFNFSVLALIHVSNWVWNYLYLHFMGENTHLVANSYLASKTNLTSVFMYMHVWGVQTLPPTPNAHTTVRSVRPLTDPRGGGETRGEWRVKGGLHNSGCMKYYKL